MEENKLTKDPRLMSPLQLAYIGDAVFELLVRSYLIENHDMNVNDLHRKAILFVKAEAQAEAFRFLENDLTEEELRIVKRGRNAKSVTVPKNAKLTDYKYATGLEALFGYLYMSNQNQRIEELFEKIKTEITR
ncbi:MAG: Ribonuclease III family protein [Clostridiales bacterium 38_11]|nr:MAG: Ribonuclease III family protein [Clostridiales bacterium 38_11]HBH13515.1 Mini-ribonuclease 3 [Clostridiales bacterium]